MPRLLLLLVLPAMSILAALPSAKADEVENLHEKGIRVTVSKDSLPVDIVRLSVGKSGWAVNGKLVTSFRAVQRELRSMKLSKIRKGIFVYYMEKIYRVIPGDPDNPFGWLCDFAVKQKTNLYSDCVRSGGTVDLYDSANGEHHNPPTVSWVVRVRKSK